LIVVNARYFPNMKLHFINGYTTNKSYTAAYNEAINTINSVSANAEIEVITLTKCIESNETGLNFGGYHVTAKFKE
jgi:hypothetical protein